MQNPQKNLNNLMEKLWEHHLEKNPLINDAIHQALMSHREQKRDSGNDYLLEHIYPVTIDVMEYDEYLGRDVNMWLVAGALLHDALEDDETLSDQKFYDLFGRSMYSIVKPLTKDDYKDYPGKTKYDKKMALTKDYLHGIQRAPEESIIIKLADRLNNLSCLPLSSKTEKNRFYMKETEEFYLPFAKRNSTYYHNRMKDVFDNIRTQS